MKWREFEDILANKILPEGTKRAEVFHDVVVLWQIFSLVDELNSEDVKTKLLEIVKECSEILLEEEVEDFEW